LSRKIKIMNKLKSQATQQWNYMQMHRGKAIGSGVGLTAGVLYGLSNAKGKWGVVGFAIAGAVAGGIVGGMLDKNNRAMVVASEGDSAQSAFRGHRTRGMGINRPTPYSSKQRMAGLRKVMHRPLPNSNLTYKTRRKW
jgi:hypothetical protein